MILALSLRTCVPQPARNEAQLFLLVVLVCLALGIPAPGGELSGTEPTPSRVTFTDVTRAAGIDFQLTCGSPEKRYIMEAMCGGIA